MVNETKNDWFLKLPNKFDVSQFEERLLNLIYRYKNKKIEPQSFVYAYMHEEENYEEKETKLSNILYDLFLSLEFYNPNYGPDSVTYGNEGLQKIMTETIGRINRLLGEII